jgi:hypothetical protein
MLDPSTWRPANPPASLKPRLMVVVDTEEEFDWSKPHSRAETGVQSIRTQERAHKVFEKYGLKPTYLCDYPVASQEDGYKPLRALCESGQCDIGTHLHPWVNPPHDEPVNAPNSYPGNLSPDLERKKLEILTETITENFGLRPTIYRAGRYGVGPGTTENLLALGYEIDTSVVPRTDFRFDHGPDFRACGTEPYWFGRGGGLLEIPLSVDFVGLLRGVGTGLYGALSKPTPTKLRLPGIFGRAGLLERIRLSPEGIRLDELKRLTEALYASGHRFFGFTYHSPSLDPGRTPYVQSENDLRAFLDTFDRYFDYFCTSLGGEPSTLREVGKLLANQRDGASARPAA